MTDGRTDGRTEAIAISPTLFKKSVAIIITENIFAVIIITLNTF